MKISDSEILLIKTKTKNKITKVSFCFEYRIFICMERLTLQCMTINKECFDRNASKMNMKKKYMTYSNLTKQRLAVAMHTRVDV